MRIRERLKELEKTTAHYDELIKGFIRNDLTAFQRLYLKDRDIKNVILMGDFLTDTIFREELEQPYYYSRGIYPQIRKNCLQNRADINRRNGC